ncbi:MAG TPA: PPC domain-containing protein [Candidatus Polarisedimenticolia bacterium]|nr:PPC domain-containing protein [Candidatus Polarisedimenticolia bacterium]
MRRLLCVLLLAWVVSPSLADLRRETEPDDNPAGAQPMLPPASVGGTVGAPGDVDWYALRLETGQTLQADVLARGFRAGQSPGSALSAVLQILDSDGATVLAQDQSQGEFDDPSAAFQASHAGKYFVAVRNLDPAVGGPAYLYVLSLEVGTNDTFESATPILPPVLPSIDALIDPPGDLDYYRLSGTAGQILTVDIDSAVFNPAQPAAKIVLTIFDPSHAMLAQDAYTAADPEDPFLQATLPTDGTYTILVRELRSFVGSSNTFYQMSVSLGPSTDDGTFSTGAPVLPPRAVSGTVSPSGDIDHFRFSLAASAPVQADLDARQGLDSLLDGTLRFHGPGGILGTNTSTPDPFLALTLPSGDLSASVEGNCSGSGCLSEDSYYVLYLDGDRDSDGRYLPSDNCASVYNPSQSDADHDGIGDLCDGCPSVFNPDQAEPAMGGLGDGCAACGPPPEIATNLVFLDNETLSWSPSAAVSSYNLYIGVILGGGWSYNHSCLAPDLPSPDAVLSSSPPAGMAYYLLVSGKTLCGEGSLGTSSSGAPRPNTAPCP